MSRPLGVLWNPDFAQMRARLVDVQRSAPIAGMSVASIKARNLEELDIAFETITRSGADGMLPLVDPFTSIQTKRIVEFAAAHHLRGESLCRCRWPDVVRPERNRPVSARGKPC